MPKPPDPRESARTVALQGRLVPYTLYRGRRRTIGLTVDQRGLRVGAPARAAVSEIEAVLHRHGAWVLDKLAVWEEQGRPPFTIAEGAEFPWLGETVRLHLGRGRNRAVWRPDGSALTLCLADETAAPRVLERALREQVREVLAGRLAHFCAQMAVPAPALALSSARTRWGSCSTRGVVRLNWRLGFFPLPVVDYVVAHEVAHLEEMNHGPRFWSLVERLCPEWRARRAELKRLARQLPVFEE